ncbi:MAG: hypothetical protein HLUCCA04_05370 [Oceanicaulis sp. HLUCCA04]|nr:MAG: hypothetical protein HLUCCA04_05370 [Oceanicaulis sp. HLUCCA04]
MAQLPYGFDVRSLDSQDDDPWTKLDTINEYLEAGEPIPAYLAQWLGLAIVHSNRDPNELLRGLGLKKKRGRQPHDANARFVWGKKVCELEDQGEAAEAAIQAVVVEYAKLHGEEPSRSAVQDWRDNYRKREDAAHCR